MIVVPNLLRVAPSGYGILLDPCIPSILVTSLVCLFVCCHSDSERGPSGGGQSGCNPRGRICETGGKGGLPPGVFAEDPTPCKLFVHPTIFIK